MPIVYNINPELHLVVYVFRGYCTANEYFNLYHAIHQKDSRRHYGMKILMDVFNGSLDFDVEGMRIAKSIVVENKRNGHPRDRVAVLTKSSALMNVREAFVLFIGEPMELEVFHNFHDAAQWLGFTEKEEQAERFWQSVLNT